MRFFAHAIHVGAYLRGFRTPATSKTEYLLCKPCVIFFIRSSFFRTFVDGF